MADADLPPDSSCPPGGLWSSNVPAGFWNQHSHVSDTLHILTWGQIRFPMLSWKYTGYRHDAKQKCFSCYMGHMHDQSVSLHNVVLVSPPTAFLEKISSYVFSENEQLYLFCFYILKKDMSTSVLYVVRYMMHFSFCKFHKEGGRTHFYLLALLVHETFKHNVFQFYKVLWPVAVSWTRRKKKDMARKAKKY